MTAMIRTVRLNLGAKKQAIDMPKRARILHVYLEGEQIAMDAVQDEDADTRAFDVSHQRYFEVVTRGAVCPGGAHVGSVAVTVGAGKKATAVAYHVYEVRGR